MTKEEILKKSRKENANADLYGKEVSDKSFSIGAVVGISVALILFIVQAAIEQEMNYGLYATAISIYAVQYIIQSVKLKRKVDIVKAVLYTIGALAAIAAHIINIVK